MVSTLPFPGRAAALANTAQMLVPGQPFSLGIAQQFPLASKSL
jgi:hypothetical protein